VLSADGYVALLTSTSAVVTNDDLAGAEEAAVAWLVAHARRRLEAVSALYEFRTSGLGALGLTIFTTIVLRRRQNSTHETRETQPRTYVTALEVAATLQYRKEKIVL
jgi:hypothetical protein